MMPHIHHHKGPLYGCSVDSLPSYPFLLPNSLCIFFSLVQKERATGGSTKPIVVFWLVFQCFKLILQPDLSLDSVPALLFHVAWAFLVMQVGSKQELDIRMVR